MAENETPSVESAKRPRIEYLDFLRVLACTMVIFIHSVRPTEDKSLGPWLFILCFCGSSCSDLFFSVSGSLLLPVKMSMKEFYHRRFLKLLPPVIFWSIALVLIYYILGDRTLAQAIEDILFIPVKQVVGVYWFVYVMIGLYLFAPIISEWLKVASRRHLEFFLIVWGINALLPYINLLLPFHIDSHGDYLWELHYFGGFLGYWLIGYYLRLYPLKIGWNVKWCSIILLCVLYVATIGYFEIYTDINGYTYFSDDLQAGSAVVVVFIYTLGQHVHIKNEKLRWLVTDMSRCSFGIYLIHIVVLRKLMWWLFSDIYIHPVPDTFILTFLTLIVSYLIIKAISYIPGSKYIIGF